MADLAVQTESNLNCTCDICGVKFHRKPCKIHEHNVCTNPECVHKFRSMLTSGENNGMYGKRGLQNPKCNTLDITNDGGYILSKCPDHPFCNVKGRVFQHRLVAEQYLLTEENSVEINGQRYLSPDYDVHHLDYDKSNNDMTNLVVILKHWHNCFHQYVRRICKNEDPREHFSKEELKNLFYEYMESINE